MNPHSSRYLFTSTMRREKNGRPIQISHHHQSASHQLVLMENCLVVINLVKKALTNCQAEEKEELEKQHLPRLKQHQRKERPQRRLKQPRRLRPHQRKERPQRRLKQRPHQRKERPQRRLKQLSDYKCLKESFFSYIYFMHPLVELWLK